MATMMETIPRRRVTRTFKTRGLTLQAAALEGIMSVLRREGNDVESVFTAILEGCKERSGGSPLVTTDLLAEVVADLTRDANDVNEEAMQLLNAFETPRLSYDAMRKHFSLRIHEERSLFGEATDKVSGVVQSLDLALTQNGLPSFSLTQISSID